MIIFIILPFWDYYFHIITLMGALLGPGPGPWALLGRARTMGPLGRARTMGPFGPGQDHGPYGPGQDHGPYGPRARTMGPMGPGPGP